MKRINVTKSFMPPQEEYAAYVQRIWETTHLTNQGPLLKEFESKVTEKYGINNFHFVTNGTLALQLALHALGITEGEVITTPFSYVATTSSILWERCIPVFVDIKPETFCIDVDKIEAAITPDTKAIMGVHVFGMPCDVEAIEEIANKHGLKVIYDGAHAFGVRYKGKSLLGYGDITTCSFHATKLFHTIEGGALVVNDSSVNQTVELSKRFGHEGDDHKMLGINAKASEFQAAMGLCNLKYIDSIIARRKQRSQQYDKLLAGKVRSLAIPADTELNYSYYPAVLESEEALQQGVERLNQQRIFPRRYFYPSLNRLPYLKKHQNCPVSEDIANRILCLPLYETLAADDVTRICRILVS